VTWLDSSVDSNVKIIFNTKINKLVCNVHANQSTNLLITINPGFYYYVSDDGKIYKITNF